MRVMGNVAQVPSENSRASSWSWVYSRLALQDAERDIYLRAAIAEEDAGAAGKRRRKWQRQTQQAIRDGQRDKTINETGHRYGLLTVIRKTIEKKYGKWRVAWVCRCDCGAERVVQGAELRRKKGQIRYCSRARHQDLWYAAKMEAAARSRKK